VLILAEERQPVLVRHRGTFGQRREHGRVRGGGPGQEQPGLAEEVERDVGQSDVLLQIRGVAAPLGEPLGEDEGVVAEHQAVRREFRGVHAVRHGGVDAGERVLEVGPERPVGIVDQETGVGVVMLAFGLDVHVAHELSSSPHMWGTLSGMS